MDSEHPSGRPEHLWWLLPLLVLASGLLLTTLIAPRSQVPVHTLTGQLTSAHHDELVRSLVRQASDTLAVVRRLAATDDPAFATQAHAFLDEFPEVSGLELLTTVSHAQRQMVERQLSEQNGQFIRFTRWTGSAESETAPPDDHYLVIRRAVFHQGADAEASSLGLVATSVPHWREALKQAREDNQATATTVTELYQNGASQRAARVFVPATRPDHNHQDTPVVALVIQPQRWLQQLLEDRHDPRWQVEIHDISQHARRPLATLPSATPAATDVPATRSTLTLANRQWMLSTRPSEAWLDEFAQQAIWPAWLTGLAVTLLASGLTAWASWRMVDLRRLVRRRTRRTRHLGRQLDNTRVEKNILHHSLQQSDRRARDLIELGAGLFAELDEGRHIGYLSPQAATLLNIPSTELAGKPLDMLFDDRDQPDLTMAFDAARRDQGIHRLDTEVVTRDGQRVPMTLRIKALKDPLSGCSGYRVSMTPRQ